MMMMMMMMMTKLQYRLLETDISDYAKFRIYVIYVWTPYF